MATSSSPERQDTRQRRDKEEPNLGQKQAKQEKGSETELKHMGDQEPASSTDKERQRRDKEEPNLGQKEAKQEKGSETGLKHMGDQEPASSIDKDSSR